MATAPRSTTSGSARPHRASRPRRGRALLTVAALLAPGAAWAATAASPAGATPATIVVFVGDSSVVEGDGLPASNASFAIELSGPAATDTYVWFHTVDGSALAGDGDYLNKKAGKSKVRIAAGKTVGNILVPVYGDTDVEGDESFTVVVDKVTTTPTGDADPGYDLAKYVGTGTIIDDDPVADTATISIGATAVLEGNTAKRNANLVVRLSQPLATSEWVYFQTEGESATSGHDFVAKTTKSKVRIPAGKSMVTISTVVLPDTDNEGDETYRVIIDKVTPTVGGAADPAITVTDSVGEVTIIDDDVPPTTPDAPTNVHAAFYFYGGEVDVTWTAPANTGGRSVTYLVERSNDFGDTWVPWASVTATTARVTCGFEAQYCTFRVSARNSVGDSSPTNQIEHSLWNCFSISCLI